MIPIRIFIIKWSVFASKFGSEGQFFEVASSCSNKNKPSNGALFISVGHLASSQLAVTLSGQTIGMLV
jgi:hypothetical protein